MRLLDCMYLLLSASSFAPSALAFEPVPTAAGIAALARPNVLQSGTIASTDPEMETQVVTSSTGTVVAGVMAGPYGHWRCDFRVSHDEGATWDKSLSRSNGDYDVGVNPTVAIDEAGVMYAVCLSAKLDYSGGVLEMARSVDDGRSWSDWAEIPGTRMTGGFPDKPWLAASGGQVALTLSRVLRGPVDIWPLYIDVELLRSFDSGLTWTLPLRLSDDGYVNRCDSSHYICGDQGTFARFLAGGDLAISWGGYANFGIVFARFPHDGGAPIVTAVATDGVSTPITTLVGDAEGEKLSIAWHSAHTFGPASAASSRDGGLTWTVRELTASGTMMTAASGEDGCVSFLWLERIGDQMDVKVLQQRDDVDVGASRSALAAPYTLPHEIDYLGGYQSLLPRMAGGLGAFFLDFRDPTPQVTFAAVADRCRGLGQLK